MTGFFPLGYDWIYFLCINFLCLLLHGLPVEKHVITWASCRKARISYIVYRIQSFQKSTSVMFAQALITRLPMPSMDENGQFVAKSYVLPR